MPKVGNLGNFPKQLFTNALKIYLSEEHLWEAFLTTEELWKKWGQGENIDQNKAGTRSNPNPVSNMYYHCTKKKFH